MSSSDNPLTGTSLSPLDVSYSALVATLVLLLAVSSAIVIRSLILRRRHQRLVEEAIRAGTWLPHNYDPSSGRRRRDFGQKPRLWEAWLHSPIDDPDGELNEKSKWVDVVPFYAAYVHSPTSPPAQGLAAGSTENAGENLRPNARPTRFVRPFTRRRPPPAPLPTTASSIQPPSIHSSSPAFVSTPAMRVGVLIAMPGAPHQHASDESGPPVVEIGVTEVVVRDDDPGTPTRDAS